MGLKVIDGTPTSISKYLRERKGCGKKIMVQDGKSNHTSFCGCTYKGLHLCKDCDINVGTDKGGQNE